MVRKLANQVPFDEVLDALLDQENPFPPTYLHRFSDLSPRNLSEFKRVFPMVEISRRRALLEDLENLADADDLVLVENIGRTCLEDTDAQVRSLAIRLLWDVEDKALLPVLINRLKQDPDAGVRATVANALGFFVYLGELEKIPTRLLTEVEKLLLEVAQSSEDKQVRRRALESLGFSSHPEVPALLRAAFRQVDTDWLESALFAMGRSADESWQQEIIRQFEHVKSSVQLEAVGAAGELGLEAAREPLLKMVVDTDDDDLRAAIIWSLSQIGGEGVRAVLDQMLEATEDDEETSIIEEALENLDFTEEMNNFEMLEIDFDEEDLDVIEDADQKAEKATKKRARKRE
jgi:HEAT repeat protein